MDKSISSYVNKILKDDIVDMREVSNENDYDLSCRFNIEKHAEKFICYLEVIIYPNGEVVYAVPFHQKKLENMLIEKVGLSEFSKLIESKEAYYDYLVFLCTQTGCCSVWNDFYKCGKQGLTQEQRDTLQKLKDTKYTQVDLPLYQGEI